jgi:tetratricopeptide (TPR) repeat protein
VLFREETQDTDLQGLAEKGAPLYTVSGAGGRGDPGSVPPGFRPSDGERFSADFGLVRLWPSTAPLSAWESYYLAARRNNRTEDAIYSLRRRAQLMPGPAGWKELASVSAKTGRVEEAREALKNALSYLPGDVWSLLMTARLAWEAGDEKTAMDYARRLPEEQERFLLEEFRKAKQDGAVGDSRRRKD